jgi:hypothetical protein
MDEEGNTSSQLGKEKRTRRNDSMAMEVRNE